MKKYVLLVVRECSECNHCDDFVGFFTIASATEYLRPGWSKIEESSWHEVKGLPKFGLSSWPLAIAMNGSEAFEHLVVEGYPALHLLRLVGGAP